MLKTVAKKDTMVLILSIFLLSLGQIEKTRAARRDFGKNIKFKRNVTNAYEITKNATVKNATSASRSEHGKWDIPFLRTFWSITGQAFAFIFKLIEISVDVFENLVKKMNPAAECKGLDTRHTYSTLSLLEFKAKAELMFPGTKWCGPGNIAKNKNDLGRLKHADKCCEMHDNCPQNIAAGKTKYGLKNTGLFTRSSCDCDENFYNCLKKINGEVADKLGKTYFNVLGGQCFLKVDCSDPSIRCRGHVKKGMQYQWSDNPDY